MEAISKITGREYKLFSYYGATDAERVIIAMGSVTEAAREAIDYLNGKGEKVGMVSVHLYRPFSVKHLLEAIPATCKRIAVLDRTKEPGCRRRAALSGRKGRLLQPARAPAHRRRPLRSGARATLRPP